MRPSAASAMLRALASGNQAMQYMLILTESPEALAIREDPDRAAAYREAWMAYAQAIAQAGVLVAGAGLMPPRTATTVRLNGHGVQVEDGPFADTKEQLGGFYVIDVPDLDAALAWAEKCPAAQWGTIEIRPAALYLSDGQWYPNG